MAIDKSTAVLLGSLGLFGAACLVGPAGAALGAAAIAAFPSDQIKKAGGGLAGHITGGLFERFADWIKDESRPRDAKNHDLRKLLEMSIANVLVSVIKAKPGGADGVERLEFYVNNIGEPLNGVNIESRFEGIREQSIPHYFKTQLEDFSKVKALTPEIWKFFLEPDYEPSIDNVKDHKLNKDQLAALNAAASALHDHLPRHLVGAYRDALEHHPEIYVAMQTAILQEIWNGVSRLEDKLSKAEQSILSEIRALTTAIANAHPVEMQTYLSKLADTTDGFRVVLLESLELQRKTHAGVEELLRRDDERQAQQGSQRVAVLTESEIQQKVRPYLEWLINRTKIIELRGIKHGDTPVIQLDLRDAYVPLQAKRLQAHESTQALNAGHRGLHLVKGERDAAKMDADVPMEKVLGEGNRLAITGGAGSGKTTVMRYIAWSLATSLSSGKASSAASRLGLAAHVRVPIPVLVSFASFARYRRDLPGHAAANLESFLSHDLERNEAPFELSSDFFRQLLREGRNVILLLDGLDEVADEHDREWMREWAAKFAADRPALRTVVTCRTVAYRNDAALPNFQEIAVQPLDMEKHIAPMVRQAYACINVDQRETRITQLLSGIEQLEEIRRASPGYDGKALVDSPLMVRLMLIVQMNNHELPDERADLFDKAVDALFQVEYGVDVDNKKEIARNWERYRDMAQRLAFHLHEKGKDQGREIEEPALKAVLREEKDFKPHIGDFLRLVRLRGGVVEERGGKFIFMHHAFQEFLVARHLREVMYGEAGRKGVLDYLEQWLADPWWREPILLTAGYRTSASPNEARKLIAALAITGESANAQFSAAELAGTAALEWHSSGEEIRLLCAQRIAELLAKQDALKNSHAVLRARAGDALSHLGDPRFDAARVYLPPDDLLGFKEIPEDKEFKIGTRSGAKAAERIKQATGYEPDEYEINDDDTPTRGFYIARYPVTVAQFKAFVDAKKAAGGNSIGDDDTLSELGNRPVQSVNWHEALEYCEWLQERLLNEKSLKNNEIVNLIREQKWCISLPSELEWEKAARGRERGLVFPWGNDADTNRANYDDTKIGGTSSVGCFAANDYGLYDMAGNVWEWTRSLWGTDWGKPDFGYPYDQSMMAKRENLEVADNVLRVLRGGAWDGSADGARCAVRLRYLPDLRYGRIGFRVVLRSPPVK